MSRKLLGWVVIRKRFKNGKEHYDYLGNGTGVLFTELSHHAKVFENFASLLANIHSLRKNTNTDDEFLVSKIYIQLEQINLDDDDYKLEIQKQGIKKLSNEEIEALDLKDLAAFAKLDEKNKVFLKDFYPDEVNENKDFDSIF